MNSSDFFFYLEGDEDIRFMENIIKNFIKKKRLLLRPRKYRNLKDSTVEELITDHNEKDEKYLFFADNDSIQNVENKKDELIDQHYPSLKRENIIIIVKEIESWYLAGISTQMANELGIDEVSYSRKDPNISGKKGFEELKPGNMTLIEFYLEVTKKFDVEIGKKRNYSFEYFFSLHIDA